MSKAFQEFDQQLSRKTPPQNRDRVPGALMSKTRCVVCGKAIDGMTGGLLIVVKNDEVVGLKAFHDEAYGKIRKRQNKEEYCEGGIFQEVCGIWAHGGRVEMVLAGDFEMLLDFIDDKYPKQSDVVREVVKQHRDRLEFISSALSSLVRQSNLVSRFVGESISPKKVSVWTKTSLMPIFDRVLSERNRCGVLPQLCMRGVDSQTFLLLSSSTLRATVSLHIDCNRLESVPKEIGYGYVLYGVRYLNILKSIFAVPGKYDLKSVAVNVTKQLGKVSLADQQLEVVAEMCISLPKGCTTRMVGNFLSHVISDITRPKRLRGM